MLLGKTGNGWQLPSWAIVAEELHGRQGPLEGSEATKGLAESPAAKERLKLVPVV